MKHFLNTCPICGNVDKCRCSDCHRVYTYNVCPECASKESSSGETTTADYDIPMAPPGRIGEHDVSYEKWKPLPHDPINLYLPTLMRKLGFQYLAKALLETLDRNVK